MSKYELLSGKHSGADGKVIHRKGDIVEAEQDLEKSFPGRFRRVVPLPPPTPPVPTPPPPPTTPAPAIQPVALPAPTKGKKPVIRIKKASAIPKDEAALAARGSDVTKQFKLEASHKLKVFQRGELFHLYELEGTKPLNEEGLKKEAVEDFVKKFLEE